MSRQTMRAVSLVSDVSPFSDEGHTRARVAGKRENRTHPTHPTQDRLETLARRVARLIPDHRNPEQFWADKSEIAAALRRLARELARAA